MGGIKGWREVKVRNGERVVKSWGGGRVREVREREGVW